MPAIHSTGDIPVAIAKILQMIGSGKLTIDQGKTLVSIVSVQANALELTELEKRISILEDSTFN